MKRRPRDRRTGNQRVRLLERDEELLLALSRFRIARTSDLARLFFPGVRRDTVSGRLRRLFDAGYLEVRFADRAEENVYSLGPEGRVWVEGAGGQIVRPPRGGQAHHLAIVRSWVSLATADVPDIRLNLFRADWEIREQIPPAALTIVPDALVELGLVVDGRWHGVRLALEVDLNTEPRSVLLQKARAYERLRVTRQGLFGWEEFGLAMVVPSGEPARELTITALLQSEWHGWWACWSESGGPRPALLQLRESAVLPLRTPRTAPHTARGV